MTLAEATLIANIAPALQQAIGSAYDVLLEKEIKSILGKKSTHKPDILLMDKKNQKLVAAIDLKMENPDRELPLAVLGHLENLTKSIRETTNESPDLLFIHNSSLPPLINDEVKKITKDIIHVDEEEEVGEIIGKILRDVVVKKESE